MKKLITMFLADIYMNTVFVVTMAVEVHRYLHEERKKKRGKLILSV